MPTQTQANIFRSSVNSYISLVFVGVFAFAAGLMIWHAASGDNPVEDAFIATLPAAADYQ